jgi:hypothetical protein
MDELMMLRLTGGAFGSGLDVTAILAFLGFAGMYVITPLIARTRERPAAMLISLYLLIAYGGIALLQMLLLWSQSMDGNPGFHGRGPLASLLLFGFAVLRTGLFLLAMVAFVIGLQSIRVGPQETQGFEDAVRKLQQLRDENADLRQRLHQDADGN